ncbi:MAG: GTP cyclohydrolase I FolE [Bacillota bacterium]|nr:GTP cyclohydrolase I FolE [Bacillota bacterium]
MLDETRIMNAVREIIEAIGEDPDREGLRETPRRIARMCEEIFCGIGKDPRDLLAPVFNEHHEEMVIIKDIPFYSMCEHHLLPFHGKAHVAYLPKGGRVVGLSKLARVVETVARRPQLQERLTSEVADMIDEALKPHGVVVVVEAEHMCMSMRGVTKPGSIAVTSAVRGLFRKDVAARAEAFSLIKGQP